MLAPIMLEIRNDLLNIQDYDTVAIRIIPAQASRSLLPSNCNPTIATTLKLAGDDAELEIERPRNVERVDIKFTGPIAKLDWSSIPIMQSTTQSSSCSRTASRQVLLNQANNNFANHPLSRQSILTAEQAEREMDEFMAEAETELRNVLGFSGAVKWE
jgi:hypothetical protein